MQPNKMENLAALCVREVKRAAAEERERDLYSFVERQCESQSKKQCRPNELSDN